MNLVIVGEGSVNKTGRNCGGGPKGTWVESTSALVFRQHWSSAFISCTSGSRRAFFFFHEGKIVRIARYFVKCQGIIL